jgi:hypothetical protein
VVFLLLPSECWDYRCEPLHLAALSFIVFELMHLTAPWSLLFWNSWSIVWKIIKDKSGTLRMLQNPQIPNTLEKKSNRSKEYLFWVICTISLNSDIGNPSWLWIPKVKFQRKTLHVLCLGCRTMSWSNRLSWLDDD